MFTKTPLNKKKNLMESSIILALILVNCVTILYLVSITATFSVPIAEQVVPIQTTKQTTMELVLMLHHTYPKTTFTQPS